MPAVAEVKKHVAQVRRRLLRQLQCTTKAPPSKNLSGSVPTCGQANAVMAPGPTTHPKTLDEQTGEAQEQAAGSGVQTLRPSDAVWRRSLKPARLSGEPSTGHIAECAEQWPEYVIHCFRGRDFR